MIHLMICFNSRLEPKANLVGRMSCITSLLESLYDNYAGILQVSMILLAFDILQVCTASSSLILFVWKFIWQLWGNTSIDHDITGFW